MKLHWLTEDSLELQFPNSGLKTKIWLRPTSNIQDELTPCLFTGGSYNSLILLTARR